MDKKVPYEILLDDGEDESLGGGVVGLWAGEIAPGDTFFLDDGVGVLFHPCGAVETEAVESD